MKKLILLMCYFLISCTDNVSNLNSDNPNFSLSITKPRTVFPNEVTVVLKGVNGNPFKDSLGAFWGDAGGKMRFDDIPVGDYDVAVYGKKDGVTILEGSNFVTVFPGEQADVHIDLNVLLRVERIEPADENQFTNDLTKVSQFWETVNINGAAEFKVDDGDDIKVSTIAAWGDNGLYFKFRIMDSFFNPYLNATNAIGEWTNDVIILYLSNGRSVDEVVDDPGVNFLDGFYRIMVEVGNNDLQNSMVNAKGFLAESNIDMENTIQNFPTSEFRVKIIQESPNTRIVEMFIPKERLKKPVNDSPKIAAMFRYRNQRENTSDHDVIGWKNNGDQGLNGDIFQWGNIKFIPNSNN